MRTSVSVRYSRRIRVVRQAAYAAWICGSLILGWVALNYISSAIYQRVEMDRFTQELALPAAPAFASKGEHIQAMRGVAFARLEVPKIALSAMIVEGVNPHDLHRGVGHVPGTSFPGSTGNVGLAAHRDTFFRHLGRLRKSDRISITTLDGAFQYEVTDTSVRKPNAVEVLESTAEPNLTLVTCYPFHYVGDAPLRFVVRARQIGHN